MKASIRYCYSSSLEYKSHEITIAHLTVQKYKNDCYRAVINCDPPLDDKLAPFNIWDHEIFFEYEDEEEEFYKLLDIAEVI